MRAGALMLCGVALAATTYVVLRGRGEFTPAPTEGVTPAATTPPPLVPVNIPFEDARPILEADPQDVPGDLRSTPAPALPAVWPGWVSRHRR